jgi:ABC-type Mn2+/Zn2+ transport system ATPase subunit
VTTCKLERPEESEIPILLEIRAGVLGYPTRQILGNLDLAIREGDFLGLVGPNGSGKTTLLKTLLGALPLRGGELIRGPGLETLGYVPQRLGLDGIFPISVQELVCMGRYGGIATGRRPSDQDWDLVRAAIAQVGLEDKEGELYRDLSGGQQQRALIARALASDSRLLLLDEPTNGMDLPSQAEIVRLLERLHDEENLTVVLVTHDLNLVAEHANRLAILRNGSAMVGPISEILNSEVLSQTYGVQIEVLRSGGSCLIRPQLSSSSTSPERNPPC